MKLFGLDSIAVNQSFILSRRVRCLQINLPLKVIVRICIFNQFLNFFSLCKITRIARERFSFWSIHEFKSNWSFSCNLSYPLIDQVFKELLMFLVKHVFLTRLFLFVKLFDEQLPSFFAIMGKQESRCFCSSILQNILRLHESIKKPK